MSTQAGNKFCQAKATLVCGQVERIRGHWTQARLHLHEALRSFTELGLDTEVQSVEAELACLNDSDAPGQRGARSFGQSTS
jgi:hypothetical protein